MTKWKAIVPIILMILLVHISITSAKEENFTKIQESKSGALFSDLIVNTVNEYISFAKSQESTKEEKIEKAEIPDATVLEVPELFQNPELPTGCESIALSILLMYDGYQLTKTTIADQYLIYSKTGTFEDGFIGNPHSYDGAGCFPSTIVQTANNYLKAQGAKETATDLSGKDFRTLLCYVAAGRPVAIWSSMYLLNPGIDLRYTKKHGYTWYNSEHCVVLAGYDLNKGTVTVSDPLEGIIERNFAQFETIYDKVGRYAVVIL